LEEIIVENESYQCGVTPFNVLIGKKNDFEFKVEDRAVYYV